LTIGANIKIYIIEDDAVQAEVLSDKLIESNDKVNMVWLKSGEELILELEKSYVRNKSYYIVLDYYLQTNENVDALNGLQVIKILAENYPKINVILYSSYDNDEDVEFAKIKEEPNVLDFIKKSEYAYTCIQNTIRFHYSKSMLNAKKRRFRWSLVGFVTFLVLSTLHFIFSFLSF
jgi:CheY-like chemotaxis protein